jgi:periplasmic protein TonB
MFMPPSAPRPRPLFVVSLAVHAALLVALAVPPLLATPELPEPDGFVRIDSIPVLVSDAPVRPRENSLGKVNGGLAAGPARRSNHVAARPELTQPSPLTELLPAPTGEEAQLPFEDTGERSEPGKSGISRTDGTGDGEGPGCEGCNVVSATAPGVTPPVALESAAIPYPELARRARVEGVVFLEAIIGADGSVRDVRVLRGAHPLLDPAATEAVRRWRYRPARIGERPVAVYLNVVVTFSLRNL